MGTGCIIYFHTQMIEYLDRLNTNPMALPPFPRPSYEKALCNPGKRLYVGFDGSVVGDNCWVYVLGACKETTNVDPVQQIDYFHGFIDGIPIAQSMDDWDIPAMNMISISSGFTVQRITALQRRWRLIRSRRYQRNMIRVSVFIANLVARSGH